MFLEALMSKRNSIPVGVILGILILCSNQVFAQDEQKKDAPVLAAQATVPNNKNPAIVLSKEPQAVVTKDVKLFPTPEVIEVPKEKKKITVVKEVSGEVAGISPNFLAITYGSDAKTSYEMALTVDKDVKVERKKKLSEIKATDTVKVAFEETAEIDERGKKRIISRIAKNITFLQSQPVGLRSDGNLDK
jgi:hypothetical protein